MHVFSVLERVAIPSRAEKSGRLTVGAKDGNTQGGHPLKRGGSRVKWDSFNCPPTQFNISFWDGFRLAGPEWLV